MDLKENTISKEIIEDINLVKSAYATTSREGPT